MLTMRWFLLLLLLVAGFTQSQNPIPSEDKKVTPPQQQPKSAKKPAAEDQRWPQIPPFIAKMEDSPKTDPDSSKYDKNGSDKTPFIWGMTAEEASSIFTFALVIVGALTAVVLIGQFGAARKEYIASHRPRLTIRTLVANETVHNGINSVAIEYVIVNTGDSRATITEISEKIWFPGNKNLPPKPPYSAPQVVKIVVEPGRMTHSHIDSIPETFEEFTFNIGFANGTHNAADRYRNGTTMLFLGYIDYVDELGARRRTAFLRKCDFVTQRFSPFNLPEYEYQD